VTLLLFEREPAEAFTGTAITEEMTMAATESRNADRRLPASRWLTFTSGFSSGPYI
jgi:hypothetical protein